MSYLLPIIFLFYLHLQIAFMNTNRIFKILTVVVAATLLTTVGIFSTPNIALAAPGYRIINNAIVQSGGLTALLQTNGIIPTGGSGGAFGYGIVTVAGVGAVIVAT